MAFLTIGSTPFNESQYNCYSNQTPHFSTVAPDALLTSCNLFIHPWANIFVLNNYSGPELIFDDANGNATNIRLIGENIITTDQPYAIFSSNPYYLTIQRHTLYLEPEYQDPTATLTVQPADFNQTIYPTIKNSSGDILFGTSTNLMLYGTLQTSLDKAIKISNHSHVNIDSGNNPYGMITGKFCFNYELEIDPGHYLQAYLSITHPLSGDAFYNNDYELKNLDNADLFNTTVSLHPFAHSFAHTKSYENNTGTFTLYHPVHGVAATFSEELIAGELITTAESRLRSSLVTDRSAQVRSYIGENDLGDPNELDLPPSAPLDGREFISETYEVSPDETTIIDLTNPNIPTQNQTIDPTHSYALRVTFRATRDDYAFSYADLERFPLAILNYHLFDASARILSEDGKTESFLYPLTTILQPQTTSSTINSTEALEPSIKPKLNPIAEASMPTTPPLENTTITIPKTPNTGYN